MKSSIKYLLNKLITAYVIVGFVSSAIALFFRPGQIATVALISVTILFLIEKYLAEQTRDMIIPNNPLIHFSWWSDAVPALIGAALAAWRMASIGESGLLIGFVVFACVYSAFTSYSMIEKSEALGVTKWTAWAKPFLQQ